jgi:hypothetical protein
LLEAIKTPDPAADEETQGILAGAYKRRSDAEPGRRDEWLRACHARYERGWWQSREANTYLGINAAATALWLGMPDQSAAFAKSVRDLLETRRQGLEQAGPAGPRHLSLWDQLTLAEAHLLLGEWEDAKRHYCEARERFAHKEDALRVASEQAKKDLVELGRPDLFGGIFPG